MTRDQVKYAKPDPQPLSCRRGPVERTIEGAVVVGDSIWDMLAAAHCRALGVGLLCGGYGASELQQATAFRVYEDPADLLVHIDELKADSGERRSRVQDAGGGSVRASSL